MEGAKILLDTYRDQVEQWCWREDWHVHGESAWTLFWKFAQLNQLTAREFAAITTNRTSGRRTAICAKPDVDLRDASVFDVDLLGKILRVGPAKVRRAFLYEILPGSVLRSHDHLRWCVQCLSRGFHSPLFQVRSTRTCPIHEHPLRDTCPSCARQIPYRLNNPFVLKPFHCPHCYADFAPSMSGDRPEILRLRKEHILDLSLLLETYRAADAELVNVSDIDRLFISARKAEIFHIDVDESDVQCRYASFIAQVVHEVAPSLCWHQTGLRFAPIERHVSGCRSTILSDDDEEDLEFDNAHAGANGPTVASQVSLAGIIHTYKAIRRRLWRRELREHQCCVRFAVARLGSRMDSECAVGFCSHALAFIRWRMLWEGCGTPKYLLVPQANDYYGIIGWHLARPCPVPAHWSTPTKAWIARHIFGATCLAAFDEIFKWAESACKTERVVWVRTKSPIDYTCLWAVAGKDRPDQPAVVYLRRSNASTLRIRQIESGPAHWKHQQADIRDVEQSRIDSSGRTQPSSTHHSGLPSPSIYHQRRTHDPSSNPIKCDGLSLFIRLFADSMRRDT
ncbi:hypothetical protein [Massilia sp.]|uniref:hypothetical protein n=1 Tax=Massilia sp. TaxID=1882437 RepID=UPI0028B18502|nr:hypothetical protein [Massilia sp.]